MLDDPTGQYVVSGHDCGVGSDGCRDAVRDIQATNHLGARRSAAFSPVTIYIHSKKRSYLSFLKWSMPGSRDPAKLLERR